MAVVSRSVCFAHPNSASIETEHVRKAIEVWMLEEVVERTRFLIHLLVKFGQHVSLNNLDLL